MIVPYANSFLKLTQNPVPTHAPHVGLSSIKLMDKCDTMLIKSNLLRHAAAT